MAEKIPGSVDPVALADRLRTAVQEMAADNFHGWVFLVEMAADLLTAQARNGGPTPDDERIREIVREQLARRSAEDMAELERRLPSMLGRVEKRMS